MPPGRITRASHQRVVEDVTNIDRTIKMKERSDDVKEESGKKDSDNVKQQGRVGLRARRRSTVTDVKTERNGTESQVDRTQQRQVVEVIVPTIARSLNTRQRTNSGSGDSMASIATRRNKHEQPTVRVSARMRAKREQRVLEDVTVSGGEESRQEINKELSPLSGISTPALSPSASTSVAVPSSPLRSCEYEEIPLIAEQEVKEMVSEMLVDEKPSKDSASTRHAANESPFQRNAAAFMNHSDQSKAPVIIPERSSMRTSRRLQSPAPMTSASEQPVIHGLRSSKAAARKASTIPFPSLSPTGLELDDEERENGALVEADLRDEKLMAVCAALEAYGNKALTAAEIGEACVQHGWIRPSPALPPANLVQSAIRAYHRRCASHIPERNCLVRKHILAGYAMEARLIPALHPSAAHDGFRRKGMVYYLEGQYGSSSWTNPFDRLEDDDAEEDIPAGSKQVQDSHAKKNPPNKRGRRPKTVNPPVQEDLDMNDDEDKPKGLKIKIKLGGVVNTSIQTSTDVMPEEAEQTEEVLDLRKRKNTYSRVESNVETEDDAGESTGESEAQQYGGAGIPILQNSDSESDDDDEQVLPQSNSIRDFARSFFMDSPPVSRFASEAPSESRMLLEQGGLFPSNALDDSFDEPEYLPALSPADPDHSSEDDDDLVTELMDYEAPEAYIKTRRHVGFDLLSYREPGSPEEREVDQEYSEVDTPATTPRTFCDDQDMEDRKDEDAQVADKDATLHLDLQNAVQVLGRLLPDLSDRPDEIQSVDRDQPIASTAIDVVQESFGNADSLETEDLTSPVLEVPVRSRRKSSVGARDFLRLSLPIPVCPAPSPLNSPFLPNQPGPVVDAMEQLLDEPSSSSTTSGDQRDPTDLELLPGLGRQPAINDGESACICNPDLHDDHVMILGHDTSACQSDQLAHLQNEFQPVTEKEADAVWAELLGPESVGVDELDNVWGFVNAAVVVAARTKSKRHRRDADGHSVASTASRGSERSCRHPQDSWGTIGVGSSADGTDRTRKMEKARFARALMTRAKALNLPSPRRTQLSPRKTLQNDAATFDDDEAIGMEDVADAVLSAWADGDTILEEECDDGDLDSETHESNQAIFTAGLQSRFSLQNDMPMGISPSELTKRPVNQVDHQVSTTLLVPASSDTTEIVEEDKDKGKDKNPAQDSRSGSIRQEEPVTSAKTNKTLSSPSIETSLPAKFPTKLPAPPRPAAHAAASPASVTSHGKIYVATTQPIWPPVHAIVIDRISLFSVLWRGKPIYRRIDSDYVNFSAILHALEAPDMKETETRLSGTIYSVILRGTDFPGINGVWLPLEIAEAEADKLDIPKDLKVVLFNGDLASLFPTPLPHLKAVLQKQGRAMASRLTMVSGRLFGIPFGCMEDTQKESTPANVPSSKPKPPTLDMVAGKRAITPSMNKNEGPPAKRRKSSSASAVSAVAARRLTRAQLGS